MVETITAATNPDDAFTRSLLQHQDMVAGGSVRKGVFLASLVDLESAGIRLIGTDSTQTQRVAEKLSGIFNQANDAETVPPLTADERMENVGKYVIFSILLDTTPNTRPQTAATDTSKIPTNNSKSSSRANPTPEPEKPKRGRRRKQQ